MQKKIRWYAILGSVLAAFFGVQSQRNYQRDLEQSSPWAYIVVALVCATLFVLILYAVVRWVLASSGLTGT